MKVKSMKKALSLLCAGAMLAGSFAVVNFDTVEASAWTSETAQVNGKDLIKVPLNNLSIVADSYSTQEGSNGHYNLMIDGNTSTYYHSNYGDGVGSVPNGYAEDKTSITLKFPEQDIKGFSVVKRSGGSNGVFKKVKVQKKVGETWTDITLEGGTGTNNTEKSLNDAAEEQFVLFAENQKMDAIRIVVLDSYGDNTEQKKFVTAAELSVLTPAVKNASGYTVADITTDPTTKARCAAPTPADKVFAGWYSDETLTQPLSLNAETTAAAYPKFVQKGTLNLGLQTLATTDSDSTSTKLRFISTVDSLNYKEAGFYIQRDGGTKVLRKSVKNVYENLYAVGENGGKEAVTKSDMSKAFSTDSQYYVALTMNDVTLPAKFDTKYICTPYWVTMDGVEVRGQTRSESVASVLSNLYKSSLYIADGENGSKTFNPTFKDEATKKDNTRWIKLTSSTSGLSYDAGWSAWPETGFNNEFTLGSKFEIDNSAGKTLTYKFSGKSGIVVFSQKNTPDSLGSYKVKVREAVKNEQPAAEVIVGTEKTVNLRCSGSRMDQVLVYSKTGLDKTKEYELVITGVDRQINVDSLHLVP